MSIILRNGSHGYNLSIQLRIHSTKNMYILSHDHIKCMRTYILLFSSVHAGIVIISSDLSVLDAVPSRIEAVESSNSLSKHE